MAGRDRPLGLRLNDIEYAKVTKLAAAKGVSVSEFMRTLLTCAFDAKYHAPADAVIDDAHRIKFEVAEDPK